MSGVSRKRGIGTDDNEKAKMCKEDGQLLLETMPFDCIEDVTCAFRSIEGYMDPIKTGDYQQILERLEKSDTLVRRKQEQDVAPEPEQRFVYIEDITELHRLVAEYVAKANKAKFEEQLRKMCSADRLIRKQSNHRESSMPVLETIDSSPQLESCHQELRSLQVVEQSAATTEEDDQVVASKLVVQNLRTDRDVCMQQYSAVSENPPNLSNQLKNIAQINFNAELLRKLRLPRGVNGSTIAVDIVCGMIRRRLTLITKAQYVYGAIDQQQFNLQLWKKLRGFENEVARNIKIVFQKLIEMIHSDGLNRGPFMWPFFRFVPDLDLLRCIASNSDSLTAEHILRARKLRLTTLCIESMFGIKELKLNSMLGDDSAGVNGPTYRKFQFGMELDHVSAIYLFKLINIITQFYDVSQASITLRSNGALLLAESTTDGSDNTFNYLLLESIFGPPAMDLNGKIRIKELLVESADMLDFLRWFCPNRLIISCDPELLISTPSLISHVDVLDCRKINADRLMEISKARVIHLLVKSEWSEESIYRVLTAHRLSTESGYPREISYRYHGFGTKTILDWKEIFECWSRTFEAEHGNMGRKVTLIDNNIDCVTLTLH